MKTAGLHSNLILRVADAKKGQTFYLSLLVILFLEVQQVLDTVWKFAVHDYGILLVFNCDLIVFFLSII